VPFQLFARHRGLVRAATSALLLAGVTGVVWSTGAAETGASLTRVSPQLRSCPPTQEFLKSSEHESFYGTGAMAWTYNYNTIGLSKSLSTSTSNTIGYSLQATESVSAGVIFASADASFSEGVTYTHNDDSTQRTTVRNIPIGEYGILQIGNEMGVVVGTYEVVDSTCQITKKTAVTGIFPLNRPVGTAAAYSTVLRPPWPQARVVSS
jgi:hypothetical protein